jgi:catechol 1,2-dioxygenase
VIVSNPDELTRQVLATMQQTDDPRLREIMTSLIHHLHGFVRDVRLTEEEFRSATDVIARMGQLTNDSLALLHRRSLRKPGSVAGGYEPARQVHY